MATLVPVNPSIKKSGTQPQKTYLVAASGQTWNAGELATEASGLVTLVASDAVDIKYYLLENQTVATGAGEEVPVIRISSDQVYRINELDGTMTTANIGNQYAITVASNLVSIDVGDTTNKALEVLDIASRYEPSRNVVADVKALCYVKFIPAVINA